MSGNGQLNENAVNGIVVVQLFDESEKFILGDCGRQVFGDAVDSDGEGGLEFWSLTYI